jgi:hypothetical protein
MQICKLTSLSQRPQSKWSVSALKAVPRFHSVSQEAPGRRCGPSWVGCSLGNGEIEEYGVHYPLLVPKEPCEIGKGKPHQTRIIEHWHDTKMLENLKVKNRDSTLEWLQHAEGIHREGWSRITREVEGSMLFRMLVMLNRLSENRSESSPPPLSLFCEPGNEMRMERCKLSYRMHSRAGMVVCWLALALYSKGLRFDLKLRI